MGKKIKIKIADELYKKIAERAEKAGFSEVENFVVSLIENIFKDEHIENYSKEEEEEIKERLKSLGYIE
jgi:hypothetical protein